MSTKAVQYLPDRFPAEARMERRRRRASIDRYRGWRLPQWSTAVLPQYAGA